MAKKTNPKQLGEKGKQIKNHQKRSLRKWLTRFMNKEVESLVRSSMIGLKRKRSLKEKISFERFAIIAMRE